MCLYHTLVINNSFILQGLSISSTTGKISWDTTYVNDGDYSVQIVTQDIHTGLRVAAEVLLRISSDNSLNGSIPSFQYLYNPFNLDNIYGIPGSSIDLSIEIDYDGDLYELNSLMLTPYPQYFESDIDIYDDKGMTHCSTQ